MPTGPYAMFKIMSFTGYQSKNTLVLTVISDKFQN